MPAEAAKFSFVRTVPKMQAPVARMPIRRDVIGCLRVFLGRWGGEPRRDGEGCAWPARTGCGGGPARPG